jgi:hypothetical protein
MAASVRCPARFLLPIRLGLRCAHIRCRGQVFQDRESPAIMAGGFFYQMPGPLNRKGQQGSQSLGLRVSRPVFGLEVSMPSNHLLCRAAIATCALLFPGDQRPGPSTHWKRLTRTAVSQ